MSYYRDQLEQYLKTLDIKADRVLDVGGLAKPIKDRVKSFEVKEYGILDLPDWDIEKEKNEHNYQAEVIFCLEVMEYVFNPIQAIKNLNSILKQDGDLYITFCFSYPHHNPAETDMLRYTEWGARKLLNESGFEIKELHYRIDKTGLLEAFYRSDGMRASKEYAHHNATGFIIKARKL